MGTIHGLGIIRRIPIVVVENNSVSGGQIDPQTSCPSAKKEYKDI
jgi:hypothetical protein